MVSKISKETLEPASTDKLDMCYLCINVIKCVYIQQSHPALVFPEYMGHIIWGLLCFYFIIILIS